MTPAPSAPAPSFLAALIPLTRYDESLEVKISADYFSLTVTVSAAGHAPLKATGTPAALEKDLPAAVAKYARWVESQEAGDASDLRITMPGETPAAKPKRVRPAWSRKAPAPKRAPKKPSAKPIAQRKAPPRRKPAAKKSTSTPAGTKPGKPECIADYKVLKAKHGDKLTRRLFVDNAKTGRRYEKLWANNWPSFVKEAEGGKAATATNAPRTKPAAASKKAATPKPKKEPAAKTRKAERNEKGPWIVRAKGKSLGVTIFEKKPGDTYACSAGNFTVLSVDAGKREIHVELAKAWDEIFPTKNPAATAAPATKPIPYAIKSTDGTTLGAIVKALAVGAKWGPFDRWEVTAVDPMKREYTVKDTQPTATEASTQPNSTETK